METPTLLIIEDSRTEQYVYRELCNRFGFKADIVASCEEAIELTRTRNYAAILMDLNLPGMDGVTCTKVIRKADQLREMHTPIIAVTASAFPEDRDRCLTAGMDGYLSKPFSMESFREVVSRWILDASQICSERKPISYSETSSTNPHARTSENTEKRM